MSETLPYSYIVGVWNVSQTIELNQVFLWNSDCSYGLVLLSLYSSRLVDISCFTLTASGCIYSTSI